MSFLAADLVAKLELVQDLAKSWGLAASRTVEPPKVTEDEVVVAEVGGTYSFSSSFKLSDFIFHPLLTLFVNFFAGPRSSDEGYIRALAVG